MVWEIMVRGVMVRGAVVPQPLVTLVGLLVPLAGPVI
jgi:hypothetical protein